MLAGCCAPSPSSPRSPWPCSSSASSVRSSASTAPTTASRPSTSASARHAPARCSARRAARHRCALPPRGRPGRRPRRHPRRSRRRSLRPGRPRHPPRHRGERRRVLSVCSGAFESSSTGRSTVASARPTGGMPRGWRRVPPRRAGGSRPRRRGRPDPDQCGDGAGIDACRHLVRTGSARRSRPRIARRMVVPPHRSRAAPVRRDARPVRAVRGPRGRHGAGRRAPRRGALDPLARQAGGHVGSAPSRAASPPRSGRPRTSG